MRVILSRVIENLGKAGEVKNVRDGYARNYLLPRELAVPATASNLKNLGRFQTELAAKEAAAKSAYRELAERLSKAELRFELKVGARGRAFGSITAEHIAERLNQSGFPVERSWIELEVPIKAVGERQVAIRLPHRISAEVRVIAEKEA